MKALIFGYYFRMFMMIFIITSMDLLYSYMADLTHLIPDMLVGHAILFIGINSIGSFWILFPIYRFISKQEHFEKFCNRVSSLPYLSSTWGFVLGLIYSTFVYFYGIKDHGYAYPHNLIILAGLLWGYSFFNAFFIFFMISSYTSKMKIIFFDEMGILFSPEKNKISYKLYSGFSFLVLMPFLLVIIDFIILGTFQKLDHFTKQTLILDIFGSIVGALICAYYITRDINEPLKFLLSSIENVRKGNYSHISPIISNDELGIITAHLNRMIEGLAEKEMIQNVFGKYVTPAVAKEILNNPADLKGVDRYITILFTDIQNHYCPKKNKKSS